MKNIKIKHLLLVLLLTNCSKTENPEYIEYLLFNITTLTVKTSPVINISATSASSGGEVLAPYATIITRGMCWSTNSNPTTTDNFTNDGTDSGVFSTILTGLTHNTTYYVRAYATDSIGTSYGEELSFTTDITLPTLTDYDGNVYKAVQIGNQVWMAENLKVTHYSNGDTIPYVESNTDWDELSDYDIDDAYCFYNNDSNSDYGALYTWSAATNKTNGSSSNPSGVQGVCPTGWHVPSDAEWTELTDYLGGTEIAGGKLKDTTHWFKPYTATNESGFSALPGGFRETDGYFAGEFIEKTLEGYWWSATESGMYGNNRRISYIRAECYHEMHKKSSGLSVRCVMD